MLTGCFQGRIVQSHQILIKYDLLLFRSDYITEKIQHMCNLSMPEDGTDADMDDIAKEKKEQVALDTYKQTSDPM